MNVVILAAGSGPSAINTDGYPLCLSEFNGKLLIEVLIQKWSRREVNFAIMLRSSDIQQYNLDQVINRVDSLARIYPVDGQTAGAACTALLAIDQINTNEPLVIVNGDELLDIEYIKPLEFFEGNHFDAGTIVFDSVHPRYSYVRVDESGLMVEAAEKKPISRNATAGFYWYRYGHEFVNAAMHSIKKNAISKLPHFICPVFNELILGHKRIGIYPIEKSAYKPFKTKSQMEQFQLALERIL